MTIDKRLEGIKVSTYRSKLYGPVVIWLWEFAVTIQRLDKDRGELVYTTVTTECLDQINALRGILNPDEVGLAS